MNVLAINGSPRGRRSNTDHILLPFVEGAREAGAETEIVYLQDHEIKPCLGCYTCWTKTPGVCVHKDNMPPLLQKLRQADVTVYASPLYIFTVSGIMKNFLDRRIPNTAPQILKRGKHLIHPPRYEDERLGRVVLISNCGFPERHHFDALVEMFKLMTQGPDSELCATILCTMGELLSQSALSDSLDWYRQAARQAGREVVESGRISAETQEILCRDLIDPELYCQMANTHWEGRSDPAQEPARAEEAEQISLTARGAATPLASDASADSAAVVPPLDGETSLREIIAGMPSVFNPAAASDLRAVVQFDISGDEPGQYHLRIADGTCTFHEGVASDATTTIHTPSDVWMAIVCGELSGTEAMVQGRYTVSGDFTLMMRMEDLFSGSDEGSPPISRPGGPIAISGMAWMSVAFVPWIVCWVLSGLGLGDLWCTALPLALSALIWLYRRRFIQTTWLDTGSLAYFGAATVLALLDSGFWTAYGGVVGSLAMAGIWMGTLATDTPLTADYSRWGYPPELARNPLFLKTNALITAFWGAVFLVQAVIGLLGIAHPAQNQLWMVARYVVLVPAGWFTTWFQKWYPARVASGAHKPAA